MRFATTLILLATAIGLGIGIYLSDTQLAQGNGEQDSKILGRFQPEKIGEIHIESGGRETVLTRSGDLWYIVKPVSDRADQATTAAVLDLLNHLTIRDKLTAEEIRRDEDLSEETMGFSEKDRIRVTLSPIIEDKDKKSGSGEKTVLIFGNVAPMSNTIFARLGDSKGNANAIYIVDGNPRKYFEDPVPALRDRNLLFAPVEQLAALTVRTARERVKVERTPSSGWQMTDPLPARANSELIESIIAQLASLQVESLLDKEGATRADPEPVPENGLVYELEILGMKDPISVYFAPAKNDAPDKGGENELPLVKARASDRPATFLLRTRLLESAPTSPNSFRDPNLARIPPQRLHSIFIQTRDNPDIVLTAQPSTDGQLDWRSDRNGKRELANRDKINALVEAVNSEKILGFISESKVDPAKYGLDQPFTAITFNIFQPVVREPGAPADTPQKAKVVQRTLKLGISNDAANDLFASFVGEPYIYQISPTFRNHVSPHPLKWKAPKVLNFSLLSLRSIERNRKGKDSLRLEYDYTRDLWTGREGNKDLKGQIDFRTAQKLAATLGSLEAQDWITTSQQAYQALNDPDVTFRIVIEVIDPALQEPKESSHRLKFARTSSSGFYYGSLDDSPDVFIIDRETYRDMIQPVSGTPASLPPVN